MDEVDFIRKIHCFFLLANGSLAIINDSRILLKVFFFLLV